MIYILYLLTILCNLFTLYKEIFTLKKKHLPQNLLINKCVNSLRIHEATCRYEETTDVISDVSQVLSHISHRTFQLNFQLNNFTPFNTTYIFYCSEHDNY